MGSRSISRCGYTSESKIIRFGKYYNNCNNFVILLESSRNIDNYIFFIAISMLKHLTFDINLVYKQ